MTKQDKFILIGLVALGTGVILYQMSLAGYPLVYWAFSALGMPL